MSEEYDKFAMAVCSDLEMAVYLIQAGRTEKAIGILKELKKVIWSGVGDNKQEG